MEEILHQLVDGKHTPLFIGFQPSKSRWCRISSIHSMTSINPYNHQPTGVLNTAQMLLVWLKVLDGYGNAWTTEVWPSISIPKCVSIMFMHTQTGIGMNSWSGYRSRSDTLVTVAQHFMKDGVACQQNLRDHGPKNLTLPILPWFQTQLSAAKYPWIDLFWEKPTEELLSARLEAASASWAHQRCQDADLLMAFNGIYIECTVYIYIYIYCI